MSDKQHDKNTNQKGFFRNNPLLVFLWAVIPIIFVFGTTSVSPTTVPDVDDLGTIMTLSVAQIISVLILFVIPVLLLSYVYKRSIFSFLNMTKVPRWQDILFVIGLILSSNLFLNYLMDLNELIPLSEDLEARFTALQESTLALQKFFLGYNGFLEFTIVLFVMAILPAVTEEMYFRGLIEGVLFDMKVGPFHAIIISSLLFAMIHFQFYYLLPLFFMGALLGYIYYRTKNLWLTILVHFINNGLIVILTATNKSALTQIDLESSPNQFVSLGGFIIFMVLLYFFHKQTSHTKFES